ncbi:Uncharacterised protein [Legionella beliardensis]|uniref:Lipoprotein n=1 Tax=Legionella beliardensis TaxID=91822 RepID=A0A378I2J6_9GAMM|nr:Uncharacterised protein [Legionella beliardensis]
MKKFVLASLSTLLLVSCSRYATNGEHIYLQSENGPLPNVPPPLTQANISHFYDLPTPGANLTVSLVPPPTEIKAQTIS